MGILHRFLVQTLRENREERQRAEMLRDQMLIIASTIHLA
jgi:hypothetical protein